MMMRRWKRSGRARAEARAGVEAGAEALAGTGMHS